VLAPPHGLSQRATSFIASQCQGIHQMPFSHSPRSSQKRCLEDKAVNSSSLVMTDIPYEEVASGRVPEALLLERVEHTHINHDAP
jgi:hypothetical protein